MGSKDLLAPIWIWRKNLGQMMAPEAAFLLSRSLRTLAVSVRAHNATGQRIAELLAKHPKVLKVNYPGLPNFAGHTVACKQMSGYGGMVSFVYDGDARATMQMVDRLKRFTIAPSLGGVESLVTQPITTTHHGLAAEERQRQGIADSLLRLSCGLEDVEDLGRDLTLALG